MLDPRTLACYTGRLVRHGRSVAYVREAPNSPPFVLLQHGIGPDGDECPVCHEIHPGACELTGSEAARC